MNRWLGQIGSRVRARRHAPGSLGPTFGATNGGAAPNHARPARPRTAELRRPWPFAVGRLAARPSPASRPLDWPAAPTAHRPTWQFDLRTTLPILGDHAGGGSTSRPRQRDVHAISNRRKHGDNEQRFKSLHRRSPNDPRMDRGGPVSRISSVQMNGANNSGARCDRRNLLPRMANCGEIIENLAV